jgi:diguanylate cyclase (GGDEF)-like protein
VAATLAGSLRRTDCSARLGGDEFAILLPETSVDQARRVADALLSALRQGMGVAGFPVSFSVGVAVFVMPPQSSEWAVRAADSLMYRAKAAGGGRVVSETY